LLWIVQGTSMKKSLRRVVPALLMLASAVSQAATYYVSASGSDTAAGSKAAPWKTLAHAQSVVAAGDTVYIRGAPTSLPPG
jgi:hypothetical protein